MDFDFDGIFHVQSRRTGRRGRLSGQWFHPEGNVTSSESLNEVLALNPRWSGTAINLQAALVSRREGMFRDVPDNLYKMEGFEPLNDGQPFPSHIVDVWKAAEQWKHRLSFINSIFSEAQADQLVGAIDNLEHTIANEYCCHEAGHVLGRPVQEKSRIGYFTLGKKMLWPLIWVEEFRADLHSYSLALQVLPSEAAAALFIYNCCARWAGDAVSIQDESYGYGTIPFMLFDLLSELGFLAIVRTKSGLKVSVAAASTSDIKSTMKACDSHSFREFTDIEMSTDDPSDWQLNAAQYFRTKVIENPRRADYIELLTRNAWKKRHHQ